MRSVHQKTAQRLAIRVQAGLSLHSVAFPSIVSALYKRRKLIPMTPPHGHGYTVISLTPKLLWLSRWWLNLIALVIFTSD